MRSRVGATAIILFLISPAIAQTPLGNPLAGLELLKPYEAMRASSCHPDWKDHNHDAKRIEPGETLTLADLEGPGIITHIWCTVRHGVVGYSRLLTIRMYWDGEEHPSVEAPLGDFFGIGHGLDRSFSSLPIRVSANGRARNCYWPMPFRNSARITVTNESSVPVALFYYYVDWQKHDSLPDDAAYFHAMYRQEFPCVMGRNYLFADIKGRGHYVGTVQSVYHMSGDWYGEGDDFFFIDGEEEPSIRGTGTEDYFCDAWGFREQAGAFYGTPLWEGNRPGDRGSAYRFHIVDPVPFKESLRVEIEHKGWRFFDDGGVDGFIERDDLMSSVAFWYQTEPHTPWPSLPPGPERFPFREEVLIEGEDLVETAAHSEAPMFAQELGACSGGKQMFFKPPDDQAWVEVTFTLAQARTLELWGRLIHSYDYGIYRALLDGEELEVIDMYNPDIKLVEHRWGKRELAAGDHTLRFECTGSSGDSAGHWFGFDALVARVPAYIRPPGKDLRDLQAPRDD